MKLPHLAMAALAVTALSACGTKTARTPADPTPADPTPANRAIPGATRASSTGTVTAIERAAGRITLDHKAIPEVGWPPMTMTFAAKPALLGRVAVGDTVAFDVTIRGTGGEVTAITRR